MTSSFITIEPDIINSSTETPGELRWLKVLDEPVLQQRWNIVNYNFYGKVLGGETEWRNVPTVLA